MRVLVTGGQNYAHRARVFAVLTDLRKLHGDRLVVIHGKCPTGADRYADEFCEITGVLCEPFPAKWSTGPFSGFYRNQEMIDKGKPDLVVAFPGGNGTADMKIRAKRFGIPIMEVY